MRSFFSALAALALFAAPAAAQSTPHRVFANINFGFQAQSQDLTQQGSFAISDETATFEAIHELDGGPFFEFGGGIGLTDKFSLGASYAIRTTNTRDAAVTASVPSPVGTDTFRTASGVATGLERSERAFHVQAIWNIPVTVEFDVSIFGGPSFFHVEDDLVESVTIAEVGGDFSQVNITDISVQSQSNTAVGFNLGIDGRYMFMPNVGAGAMLRYTRGSVDLTSPTGEADHKLDVGGLEIAAGLRFKF
jgi:opacity protein-like surface antigen